MIHTQRDPDTGLLIASADGTLGVLSGIGSDTSNNVQVRDTAGTVRLTVTTSGVTVVGVTSGFKRSVAAKTADYTVLAVDSGAVYTNDAAAGTVVFALPAAVVGLEYLFVVKAAQELRIDPNGTETIGLPSSNAQQAAGKYITANADGEYARIVCAKAGMWEVVGYVGTWTVEP